MKLYLRPVPDLEKARDYTLERLSEGGAIAQVVSKAFPTWVGSSRMLVDDAFREDRLDFRYGGHFQGVDTISALADLLCSDPDYTGKSILIHDLLAKKSDPFLSNVHSPTIYLESEVYHLANSNVLLENTVKTAISDAFTAQGLQAFLFSPGMLNISGSNILDLPVPQHVSSLVIDIFDGETFLIWNQTERSGDRVS